MNAPTKKVIKYKGIVMTVYTLGWLAHLSGCSIHTLRFWEGRKVMPRPIFKLPGHRRWYTSLELIHYAKGIKDFWANYSRDSTGFKVLLHNINAQLKSWYKDLAIGSDIDPTWKTLPNEDVIAKNIRTCQKDKTVMLYEDERE
jgi:DNA-binding transcriptional MerR regulator